MTIYGRTVEDVLRWPDDPAARRALEVYLGKLPSSSPDVVSVLDAENLNFNGADLSGLELLEAELSQADLSGVSILGADLAGAWLIRAKLRGANLAHADLRSAQGRECDAQGATFRGAALDKSEFEKAVFQRADLSQVRFGSATLFEADLRAADLRRCVFGHDKLLTTLLRTRIAGSRVEGASGTVRGPADVGAQDPQLLDGAELQRWFADHGAPLVEVRQ